jgi:hypothetical protein
MEYVQLFLYEVEKVQLLMFYYNFCTLLLHRHQFNIFTALKVGYKHLIRQELMLYLAQLLLNYRICMRSAHQIYEDIAKLTYHFNILIS